MLKNAYLLAKIGADTAENERHFAENLPNIGNYPTGEGGGEKRTSVGKRTPGIGRYGPGRIDTVA